MTDTPSWQPGDGCVFIVEQNVRIFGVVEAVVDDTADVIELHADHPLWGGSGLKVGEIHSVPAEKLIAHKLRPFEEQRWADIKAAMG